MDGLSQRRRRLRLVCIWQTRYPAKRKQRGRTIQGTIEGNVLRFRWEERRELIEGLPRKTEGGGYCVYVIDHDGEHELKGESTFATRHQKLTEVSPIYIQCGLQETSYDQFRNDIHHAHLKAQRFIPGPTFEGAQHLVWI